MGRRWSQSPTGQGLGSGVEQDSGPGGSMGCGVQFVPALPDMAEVVGSGRVGGL